MPVCSACLPAEVHDAPGVGFDLTTTYATSAFHMYDGSIANAAGVSANPDYMELMLRLAHSPLPPPQSKYQRFIRWFNKKCGRPSTPDVGILSSLITDLHEATRSALPSYPIDKVVITTPLLPALTSEDLNDAIEYAGLRSWLIYSTPYPKILAESRSLFAANGNGLCKNYKHLYECEEEENKMPVHTVYSVTFTRQALYTTLDTFRSPFGFTSRSEAYLINFNSGLDSLPTYPSPLDFWKHVRSQLLSLPRKSDRPITKVLLAGESVTDAKFLNILRDSLAEIAGPSARREASDDEGWRVNMTFAVDPDIGMLADPVFAAARGAALYARWRQEAPYDCVEHERCEAERRREMEKGPDELR
ncbi:MAG: hypothetical protein M1813_008198 [Trichoglossum hirsutum]|nr:MAG: hypothetical protein M1813_008198 [Trichoglossum hirsutum]